MLSRNIEEPETTRSTASKTYHDLATDTRPGVRKALDGSDDSDLITSFRRAFSLSVPPATLYRNFRSSGNSNLTFGVPLIDPTSTQYDVPYVIRTCIAEVESRGLNFNKIYSVSRSRVEVMLGLLFSGAGRFYKRRRSTTGKPNPSLSDGRAAS